MRSRPLHMQSLWMLFAAFLFSVMGVCVKLASDIYSTAELVMYRNLVGVLFLGGLIIMRRGSLRTIYWKAHVWRGLVGIGSLWMWFYAITHLPLATGMTLNYLAPVWMAGILLVAGLFRRERALEWGLALAIACSFVGVTLMLQPSFDGAQWFAVATGLASGFLSAFAYLAVRKLGQLGEPEYRVVFYFSLIGVLAGAAGTFLAGNGKAVLLVASHGPRGLLLLLAIGMSATLAQIAMTRAYRLGNAMVTANLQYSGIIFASMWGILLWGDVLGWISWLGMAIILASGSVATYYNTRSAPRTGPTIAKANDPIATEV